LAKKFTLLKSGEKSMDNNILQILSEVNGEIRKILEEKFDEIILFGS
jgi:hypothetical protein